MHPALDGARLSIKLGEFATGPAAAVTDPLLLPRVQEHRRLLSARMVALRRDELKKELPSGASHLSRKVDGEFAVLVHHPDGAFLLNPGGTVRVGLPCIAEAAKLLKAAGIAKALVAGELHYARPDGKRSRVHDVARAARQPESQADLDALRFAAFDVLETEGKQYVATTAETFKLLEKVFKGGKAAAAVEGKMIAKPEEAQAAYDAWVEKEGAEGLVVRSDAAGWFKIKPQLTIDAVVVGFTEGTLDRKGLLHDVLVALMRGDGSFQLLGRVGGGFTDEDRRGFLADLRDMVVESHYAEVNADHVAYSMVRPEWVIEISCLDLVSRTTRDLTMDRMVLTWDSKAPRWEPLRRLPLASMIAPQFVRRRDDKMVRPADLRIQQVSDVVDVPNADRDARTLAAPKSELLKREVFTKVFKGATMVRKLVMWKTNKEADPAWPAYVVHFTDFSPGRKTPLEREIRVSSSRKQIEELYAELTKENIVKGWAPAAS
jgi:hypothetical protein